LLVDQVGNHGQIPGGQAELFTGFVREALRREVELENHLFKADTLLTDRDCRHIVQWEWPTPFYLPERGLLLPKAEAVGIAIGNKTGLEQGLDDIAKGVMHHAIPKRCCADLAGFGVVNHKVDISAGPIGESRQFVLQRQESVGKLVFKKSRRIFAPFVTGSFAVG
jgi:hypothetical protein